MFCFISDFNASHVWNEEEYEKVVELLNFSLNLLTSEGLFKYLQGEL